MNTSNENKKLKCYFAFSDDIINKQYYVEMLKACLESARRNTTLDLYCLYDGKEGDSLYNLLMEYNVNVKIATIPFYNELSKIYTKDYMLEKFGQIITEGSMRSRFLRMMISQYEDDEYFLYCDTDIIFLKDITLDDFPCLPKEAGVCPEFERSNDYNYFNAGVMLINTDIAKSKYNDFMDMINNGIKAEIECCDQGYLNELYKKQYDKLPLEYNWKPYWGINENAKIIHFHGVKPNEDIIKKIPFLISMLLKYESINSCFHYYDLYSEYVDVDKNLMLHRLIKALLINQPQQKINKRKIYKIIQYQFLFNFILILSLFIYVLLR